MILTVLGTLTDDIDGIGDNWLIISTVLGTLTDDIDGTGDIG